MHVAVAMDTVHSCFILSSIWNKKWRESRLKDKMSQERGRKGRIMADDEGPKGTNMYNGTIC